MPGFKLNSKSFKYHKADQLGVLVEFQICRGEIVTAAAPPPGVGTDTAAGLRRDGRPVQAGLQMISYSYTGIEQSTSLHSFLLLYRPAAAARPRPAPPARLPGTAATSQ